MSRGARTQSRAAGFYLALNEIEDFAILAVEAAVEASVLPFFPAAARNAA